MNLTELVIRCVPIKTITAVYPEFPAKKIRNGIGKARKRLLKAGWSFPCYVDSDRGPDGEDVYYTQLSAPIPPVGITPAEIEALLRFDEELPATLAEAQASDPSTPNGSALAGLARVAKLNADYEAVAGRPLLTWREMAILGWPPRDAAQHRGCLRARAQEYLRLARQKLRAEGWVFITSHVPAGNNRGSIRAGAPPHDNHREERLREIADAQLKSNWYSRVPAHAASGPFEVRKG